MMKQYFYYLCEKNKKILESGYLITIIAVFMYMLLGTKLYEDGNPNAVSLLVITIGVILTMVGTVLFVAFSINLFYSDLFSPVGKFDYSLPVSTITKQFAKQILSIVSTLLLLIIMMISILVFGLILGIMNFEDVKNIFIEILKVFKEPHFYKVAIYYLIKVLAVTNLTYAISIFIKPVINTKLLNVVTSFFLVSFILKIPSLFFINDEFFAYDVLDLLVLQNSYFFLVLGFTSVVTILSYILLNYVENKYLEI